LGCCFAFGFLGQGIGVAEAVIPNFSSRLPWEGFSLKSFKWVAYQKIKDGINMEVQTNLSFIRFEVLP
jgi:hypothetical protein